LVTRSSLNSNDQWLFSKSIPSSAPLGATQPVDFHCAAFRSASSINFTTQSFEWSLWPISAAAPDTGASSARDCAASVHEAPNHSIERTRNGMPRMAVITFSAMRVTPLRAAHVKR